MKPTILVLFVCGFFLIAPAVGSAQVLLLSPDMSRSFALEEPTFLKTAFLRGRHPLGKTRDQRFFYGNPPMFENLTSTLNAYYTLIGVGAVALTSTLVVGNSVAYHTQAKNRMAWGISGVVFGSLGIATSLSVGLYFLVISPKGAWPLFLIPFAVSSVYLGLGVANIVSSQNDSREKRGRSPSGPLVYAIPWITGSENNSVTVGLSFVGMNF